MHYFSAIPSRYERQIYGGIADSQLRYTFTARPAASTWPNHIRTTLALLLTVLVQLLVGVCGVSSQVNDPKLVNPTDSGWRSAASPESGRLGPVGDKRVALVLSGGGARGFAQIGVLRVLEQASIRVDAVVGTSIGAIVGGLYCAGYTPDELDSIVRHTDWPALLGVGDEIERSSMPIERKANNDRSLLTLRFDGLKPQLPEALSIGGRMSRLLDQLVWSSPSNGNVAFDDLAIPFRAVATDLVRGNIVVIDSGSLSLAMRASATVPLRFSPVRIDSMLLVDGGLLRNVPVDIARSLGCDFVIVVNTTSGLLQADKLDDPLNVADQVVTLMMRSPSNQELGRADFVITPELGDRSGWSFDDLGSMIDSGESSARRVLAALTRELRRDVATSERLVPASALAGSTLHAPEPSEAATTLSSLRSSIERNRAREPNQRGVRERVPRLRIAMHGGEGSTRVEEVQVVGKHVDADEMSQRIIHDLAQREVTEDDIRDALERVTKQARAGGLSFFRIVAATLDSAGVLHVDADGGEIRSIVIAGVTRSDTVIVTRELGLGVGDRFEASIADAAVTRLLATGFFAQARLDVRPRADRGLDVLVEVAERSTAVLRVQASVDNERYTQIGIELAEENLLGSGTRLAARASGGLRDRVVELNVGSERIDATQWTFGVSGYGTMRNINRFERTLNQIEGTIARSIIGEFRQYRIGVRAKGGRQVGSVGLLSVQGRYERQGAAGVTVDPDDPAWRSVATLSIGARVDTRDRYPYPRSGAFVDLSYETSLSVLGADAPFVKFGLEGAYSYGVGPHTLRPRVKIGFADLTLPPAEFYAMGGDRTLYGLREDELRGRQLFLASLEYRYQLPFSIYFDTYASLRYDLGTTWLSTRQIRLGDLDHGIGFSLGLDTPVGPADFSIGRSFTFNAPDRPSNYSVANFGPIVAYFSIGYRLE